jgi:hypothetical protein
VREWTRLAARTVTARVACVAWVAGVAPAAGCVFPGQEPTGLELSWRFVEANLVDGEDALRVRSCHGVNVAQLRADVADEDDDTRAGQFAFDCELGFQTVEQFQTAASDAYLRLSPGNYSVAMFALDGEGAADLLSDEVVDVAGRQITVQSYVLSRITFDWTVQLESTDTCVALALDLSLDDPAADLALPGDEEAPETVRYREALVSDRALSLSGGETACSADLAGSHVVPDMDRGTYRLDVIADGQTCSVRVEIGPDNTDTVIDLAALPCDG